MNTSLTSTPPSFIEERLGPLSIGENAPYLYPLEDLILKEGQLELNNIEIADYQFLNFGKLIQLAGSIGSSCLFNQLALKDKNFFLAEKFRIRKVSYHNENGLLSVKARAISTSNKKGKAIIDISDESHQLKYRLELDCTIISENLFYKLFKSHSDDREPGDYINTLPALKNVYHEQNRFTIEIDSFSKEQCKGHFPGFPIVPGCFIVSCLLKGIKEWFEMNKLDISNLEVENLELFINKASPVMIGFLAEVSIKKIQGKIYIFNIELQDANGIHYGFYLITIQQ